MKKVSPKPLIGIAGGMGPAAGVDLANKIIRHTLAHHDGEHLAQILYTDAAAIGDRTAFLLGETGTNPGFAIARILLKLEEMGATVAGIPCNTAHAPVIFHRITQELKKHHSRLLLLNMVTETGLFMKESYPKVKKAGILGTLGLSVARPYDALDSMGIQALYLPADKQEHLHKAIYDEEWGIKAVGFATSKALKIVRGAIDYFARRDADAVVLACTELALIDSGKLKVKIPVINSTLALARGLIRAVAPEKLRPPDSDKGN
jgi:aspartate racemase